MRKTPRQARSRATVERLLAAARAVLEQQGYDGFSTNRVAAEAGVSPGSLYQYFADKAEIVEAVIDRWSVEVSDRVAASLADRIGTAGEALEQETADALLAALEADAPLLRVVWEELPAGRYADRRLALERRVRELVTAYLGGQGVGGQGARVPDPAATAWVLVMAVQHVAVRWVLDQPPIPREQVVGEMAVLARALLGGRPGAAAG